MNLDAWLTNEPQLQLFPATILCQKAQPLIATKEKIGIVAERMFKMMYANKGIGLAANQINLPYRIFVMNKTGDPSQTEEEHVFVNPVIIKLGRQIRSFTEGCLSLPGINADVDRPFSVVIEYHDLAGKKHKANYASLFARAILHENDHLDGILFIDRLTKKEKEKIKLDFLLSKFMTSSSRQESPSHTPQCVTFDFSIIH